MSLEKIGLSFLIGGVVGASFKSSVRGVTSSISHIDNKIKELSREKLNLNKTLNLDNPNILKTKENIASLTKEITRLTSIKNIKIDISSNVDNIKTQAKNIFGIAVSAAGSISAPVKFAMDFEHSLQIVSTLFGDTSVDVENLSNQILSLSSNSGVAATEISSGLYEALSSGLPVTENMAESLSFMEKNIKLAKAGLSDVATVTKTASSILNSYNLNVSETDRVHKILMQTQNFGTTTVGELGASLSGVTSVAATAGVSLEQLGASMATLTHSGTGTAESVTMLRALISELMKSGTIGEKNLAAALSSTKYAGKSFKDLASSGIALSEILNILGDYAKSNNKSMIDMFGSIEAGNAALKLSGTNADFYMKSLQEMNSSVDVVDDAYKKVSSSLSSALGKLKTSFVSLSVTVGKMFLPQIKLVANKISEFTTILQKSFEEHKALFEKIIIITAAVAGFVVAVKTISITLSVLGIVVKSVALTFMFLKSVVGIAGVVFKVFTVIVNVLKVAIFGLGGALRFLFLSTPIGWIALAIAAIVALYKNWDKVKEIIGQVWDKIKETFGNFIEYLKGLGLNIKEFFINILNSIIDAVTYPIDKIKNGFSEVKSFLGLGENNSFDINKNTTGSFSIVKDVSKSAGTIGQYYGKNGVVTNNTRNMNAPVTYAPNITIQGNANKQDILEAEKMSQREFEKMYRKQVYNDARLGLSSSF